MKNKKILYLSPGFFHAREDLFISLSEKFNIRFIEASSRLNGYPTERYKTLVNFEIWKYNDFRLSKLKKKYIIPLCYSIFKELLHGKYDLVISSTQHPLYAKIVYLLKPFFKYKIAYVNEVWDYKHKKNSIFNKLYDKISMHIVKKADFVLNEGIRSTDFMLKNGIRREKCYLWPMVSVDMATKEIVKNKDLENAFNIGKDRIKYAYIGRLTEAKGANDIFNAFELLNNEHKAKSMLYFIGKGPLSEELKKRSMQYENIKIIDWVDSQYLPYIYNNLDFFVLASHFDGFSTVSCEAASMSLPLILTDMVGAVPDLIGECKNGYVVPANNSQELSKALTLMLELSPNERKKMGSVSRLNFIKSSSISININSLNSIVSRL